METDDPLEQTELTFLLGMAFQLVLSEFVSRLDAAGYADLRPMHGLVFQVLHGSGATSSELAEELGVTKQAAARSSTTWRSGATWNAVHIPPVVGASSLS